ncbi:MAG: transcription termination/antitermination factor NusG [Cytophagales bacterium]|nr:MAG: transcription termination/antitermination factor NusG [Cytophagales bacterium]TAF60029.1 MAG: transcription termination/antitermination factor NusG [Cytophagales bacterium]
MDNFKWYILRVVSGQEKNAKSYMERELTNSGLKACVPQIVTPTEKVYQMRKSKDGKTKRIAVEKSYLPGYILINADFNAPNYGEVLHKINDTPGVIGFLDMEEVQTNAKRAKSAVADKEKKDERKQSALPRPRPMRESEVNRILGKVEEAHEEVKYETRFFVGESVKVMEGPFSGFTGKIEEVFDEKKKVNVMVTIFGRNAPIELNYTQVEKLDQV